MTIDEVIVELQQLKEPVPRPLRLPTSAEVADAERQLGITFHPNYRKYLLEASDVVYGSLEPAVLTIKGSSCDLLVLVADARKMGVPKDWLPICYDNGNYFCLTPSGEVRFWDHDGTNNESWPNLATWIKKVWIEHG